MLITTPRGDARVHLDAGDAAGSAGTAGAPVSLLVLGHGAGGGVEAPDLVAVTRAATGAGVVVARVVQPYRVAGRRAPAPAHHLDEAWCAVVDALRTEPEYADLPVVVAGRSSGGRVACRTADAVGASAVITLAFPLHPPGRPEKSRLEELSLPKVPVLVVQGDRDAFGMPGRARRRTVSVVPGADHSLKRDPEAVATAVVRWLRKQRLAR